VNPFANWKESDVQAHNERVKPHKTNHLPPRPEPQPIVCHEPLGPAQGKAKDAPCLVRIVSHRRRLLDIDNLTGGAKYFCDGLRYAGLIPGDRPDQITLEVSQRKVKSKAEERTEIEIENGEWKEQRVLP
jgi:hypothetical protein